MRAVINFYLTWNCNFYCGHCVHECGPGGNNMTDEQIEYGFNFIEWLLSRNIPVVIIGSTGGEPTLHPKFWSYYIPLLTKARAQHKLNDIELHTNASLPVPEEYKKGCSKFFSQVIVGHDQFHRAHVPLSKLYLQDYTDISNVLVLRQNKFLFGDIDACIVRNKGRAADLIKSGKYEVVPVNGFPKLDCNWGRPQAAGDVLNISFTPDHINHCGEKSHVNPAATLPEGQFHPYTTDYETIVHSAMDYCTKYCGDKCSQPCYACFIKKKNVL